MEGWEDLKKGMVELGTSAMQVGKSVVAAVDNEDTRKGLAGMAKGMKEVGSAAKDLGIVVYNLGKEGIKELAAFLKFDEWSAKLVEIRKQIITQAAAESIVFFNDIGRLTGESALETFTAMIEAATTYVKQVKDIRILAKEGIIKTEEEEKALLLMAAQKYEETQTKIHDEAIKKRWGISKVYHRLEMESSLSFFHSMSLLMDSHHKSMFKIGKAAAIAETIIQTYKAAQGAYASLSAIPIVGPALGAAAAVAAVVSGMARVQAIRAQQIGDSGGGAVGTFSASPTTGLPVGSDSNIAGVPQPNQNNTQIPAQGGIQIIVQGNVIGNEDFVRGTLIPILRNEINNRSVTIIGQKSRQAKDIQAA